jgi:hypothetical protein
MTHLCTPVLSGGQSTGGGGQTELSKAMTVSYSGAEKKKSTFICPWGDCDEQVTSKQAFALGSRALIDAGRYPRK